MNDGRSSGWRSSPRQPFTRAARSPEPHPTSPFVSASMVTSSSTDVATSEWLVLERTEGEMPDLRAVALVCRALRRALMSGYRRVDMGDAIPEIVSGHTADRSPTRRPHLAVAPLAFAGYPHADGRVFGFALVPPAGTSLRSVPGLVRAFEAVAPYDPGRERRVLKLEGPPLSKPLHLAPAGATPIRSLSPWPYLESAQVWAGRLRRLRRVRLGPDHRQASRGSGLRRSGQARYGCG